MKKNQSSSVGESLKKSIAKAWAAFDDPENQKRIAELNAAASDKDVRTQRHLRIKKLRRWGVPKIASEIVVDGPLDKTSAVLAVGGDEVALLRVLAGNPGCGKTIAACTRIEDRETGLFVRAAELVELGSHYSDRNLLSSYRRCGVLVIDDLGIEYRSDQMICRLDELLDSRAGAGMPTIITTNFTADEFRARYEERLWSRIHQFGSYVELDDPDLRVTPIGQGRRP